MFPNEKMDGKSKGRACADEKTTGYTFERRCVLPDRLHIICIPNNVVDTKEKKDVVIPDIPEAYLFRRKIDRINGLNGTRSILCLRDCWEKR